MRIFLVSDSYPPLIGGATRATQLLAQELVKRGHTVMVATAWQKNFPSREMDGEVEVARLRDLTSRAGWVSSDAHRHTPPPFPDPEATPRLRRLITRFRPDVVHAYGWLAYSAAAALEGLNVPMLLSARDYGNICALRTLVKHGEHAGENCSGPAPAKCMGCATSFYGRPKGVTAAAGVLGGRALLRRRVTGLHSCSTYVETLMMQSLFGDDATLPKAVLPDFRVEGSDDSATLEHEVTARLPKEPFIMFVGALRLIKGIVPLLDAYAQLENPPPLVLIGTPAPDTPASFPPGVTVIQSVPHATVMATWERALFGVAPFYSGRTFGQRDSRGDEPGENGHRHHAGRAQRHYS